MSKKSKPAKSTTTATTELDPRLPKIGAVNTKVYREVTYTWKVTDKSGAIHISGGKLKRGGEDFASVSSAANHLTTMAKAGGRVSGFVFFDLGAKEGGKMAKAEAKADGGGKPKARKPAKARKASKPKAKAKGAKHSAKPKAKAKSKPAKSKANSVDVSHTSSNPAAVVSE